MRGKKCVKNGSDVSERDFVEEEKNQAQIVSEVVLNVRATNKCAGHRQAQLPTGHNCAGGGGQACDQREGGT